jgi:pyrroloquinoline quinone (PQQ) biosynthesis protein C
MEACLGMLPSRLLSKSRLEGEELLVWVWRCVMISMRNVTADNLASLYCCPHVKGLRLDEISYFVAVIIFLKSCTHTLPNFTNTLGGSIHRGFALFWCEGE